MRRAPAIVLTVVAGVLTLTSCSGSNELLSEYEDYFRNVYEDPSGPFTVDQVCDDHANGLDDITAGAIEDLFETRFGDWDRDTADQAHTNVCDELT